MKFSEINEQLSAKFNVISSRILGDVQIYSTISSKLSETSDDGVLVYSNNLCIGNNNGTAASYLFCGNTPITLPISSSNWIEVSPDDFMPAVKFVEDMLHYEFKFQTLRMRMMDMLMSGKSLGIIADEMGKSLNTTIVIMDMTGKIVTYSHPFMIKDPLWKESIDRGFCPPFFIEHLKDVRNQYAAEKENGPVLRHCIDNQIFYLASRIFINGELYGYAFMLQTENNFDPCCKDVIEYIGHITTEWVFRDANIDSVKNAYYDNLLIDIFRGISSDQIKARISAGEMKFPQRMCIAAVKPRYFQGDNYVKENLSRLLKQIFPKERFVYYHKILFILFALPREAAALPEDSMKMLNSLCQQEHLIAGVSNPYSKITSTKHYYEQAIKAIELAGRLDIEGNVHEYKNVSLYDLINNDAGNHKVGFYCHPALKLLTEYDTANGSQLHDTLRSLVDNGFNSSTTATELFLHRNTLSYRKQKIVSLTGLDLDDFSTQFMLKYSFMIENYLHKNAEINIDL